jgi:hypothetical protein
VAGAFWRTGDLSDMSSEVEYRRYAAALLDLAKRSASAADKLRLLVMAQAWLTLDGKIARPTKRRPTETERQLGSANSGPDQPRPE